MQPRHFILHIPNRKPRAYHTQSSGNLCRYFRSSPIVNRSQSSKVARSRNLIGGGKQIELHLETERARKLPRIGTRRVVGRRAHTGLYLEHLESLTLRFVVNFHNPRLHSQRSPSKQCGAAKHFLVVLP